MNPPSQTLEWKGKPYTITWFSQPDAFDFSTISPITQAYGVCITDTGEAVVLDQEMENGHCLVGRSKQEKHLCKHWFAR